jgi:L-lactate dehydrogenase
VQGIAGANLVGTLSIEIRDVRSIRNDAILLLISNPIDVLTHFTQRMSGLAKGQVIGTGMFLDLVGSRVH